MIRNLCLVAVCGFTLGKRVRSKEIGAGGQGTRLFSFTKVYQVYFLIVCSQVSCSIFLAPGYQEVRQTWEELVGKSLDEVQQYLTVALPGVQFRVFRLVDLPAEFYFNKIKIVVDESNTVIQPPKFFGHEPNFSLFGDLVGKPHREVQDVLKTVIKEMIVTKKGDLIASISPGSSPTSENYVLLEVDDDSLLLRPPRYVRIFSNGDGPGANLTTVEPEVDLPRAFVEPEADVTSASEEPELGTVRVFDETQTQASESPEGRPSPGDA